MPDPVDAVLAALKEELAPHGIGALFNLPRAAQLARQIAEQFGRTPTAEESKRLIDKLSTWLLDQPASRTMLGDPDVGGMRQNVRDALEILVGWPYPSTGSTSVEQAELERADTEPPALTADLQLGDPILNAGAHPPTIEWDDRRDAVMGAKEPPGSYGHCWKELPGGFRCVLAPGHMEHCQRTPADTERIANAVVVLGSKPVRKDPSCPLCGGSGWQDYTSRDGIEGLLIPCPCQRGITAQ